MRFAGKVFKAGTNWAVEIPILDIATHDGTALGIEDVVDEPAPIGLLERLNEEVAEVAREET